EVVPTNCAAPWIRRALFSWEHILPDPFPAGVARLALKGRGQKDFPIALAKILRMEQLRTAQVLLQWCDQSLRQRGYAVFTTFAMTNDRLTLRKIQVLDAQPHTLHQAQPTAIQQLGHQLMDATHRVEHTRDFFTREHSGQAIGLLGAYCVE